MRLHSVQKTALFLTGWLQTLHVTATTSVSKGQVASDLGERTLAKGRFDKRVWTRGTSFARTEAVT